MVRGSSGIGDGWIIRLFLVYAVLCTLSLGEVW